MARHLVAGSGLSKGRSVALSLFILAGRRKAAHGQPQAWRYDLPDRPARRSGYGQLVVESTITVRRRTRSIRMDLDEVISKLRKEREKLDEVIASLEQLSTAPNEDMTVVKGRRGRKSMDEPARKEVSERMKKYWAWRKKNQQELGPAE
jgi:hypothetical protein